MSIDQEAPVPRSQLVDYDRFNNSLTKLRDKKEKSLNDEKNLFKVCFVRLESSISTDAET